MLADALASGQLAKLEGLYLSHCDVGPSGAEALSHNLQGATRGSVVRLGLNFNRRGDAHAYVHACMRACVHACMRVRVYACGGDACICLCV